MGRRVRDIAMNTRVRWAEPRSAGYGQNIGNRHLKTTELVDVCVIFWMFSSFNFSFIFSDDSMC
jgi:hypothetical protein